MIESAKPPAQALWWWPSPRIGIVRLHRQREDEDADHDRREAVQDVEPELHLRGERLRRELADVDRDQRRRPGARSPSRSTTSMSVPTIAGAMPPPVSPKTAGPLVNRFQSSASNRRARTPSRRGSRARRPRTARRAIARDLGDAVDAAAAAVARPVAFSEQLMARRSMPSPLELRSKRWTIRWATTFVDERDHEQDQRRGRASDAICDRSSARSGSCFASWLASVLPGAKSESWSGWSCCRSPA